MDLLTDDKAIIEAVSSLKTKEEPKQNLILRTVNNLHTLVIVVDMINGFLVSGALSNPRCNKITGGVKKLLEKLNNADVVFMCDSHLKTCAEFKNYPPHCMGDFESEVVEPLKGFKGSIIKKNSTNGFFALKDKIDFAGYNNFIIVGVCSDICVMQLALTLKGYFNEENEFSKNVVVLSDLIETFSLSGHDGDLYNLMAVRLMENAGIQIFNNVTD